MNKKAQADFKGVFLSFIVAGLMAVFGVVVFSNLSNTSNSLFDSDRIRTINESVTISVTDSELNTNSTVLSLDGYISNSEQVLNSSNGAALTRNVDYRITTIGVSGSLTAQANLTLLNVSHFCDADTCPNGPAGDTNTTGYNNTALRVSYDHNEKGTARLTKDDIDSTFLDSMDLGVVAVLILAAVLILGSLFYLGNR